MEDDLGVCGHDGLDNGELTKSPPTLLKENGRFKSRKLRNSSFCERQTVPFTVWQYINLAHRRVVWYPIK
jgi:hypothetical protein